MKGITVLVVEDDETYTTVLTGLFETRGATVYRAGTLADALHALTQWKVSCVLVDLSLPDAKGLEAVKSIVKAGNGAPVGVLTGSGEMRREALAAGAVFYLSKGDLRDNEELVQAIRDAATAHAAVRQQVSALHDSIHEAEDLGKKVQAAVEAERKAKG